MQTETITLSNGEINIKVVPSTKYVLDGILNKLYVMIELNITQFKEKEEKERAPLELALVLDKSGSMSGPKLANSKIALQQIIDNLTDRDKVHGVVYDNQITTVFEDGNLSEKDSLKKKIDKIRAGATTNLSGGVVRGFELLNKTRDRTINKRIFLFSDGLANEGITDRKSLEKLTQDIHDNGVNVSTFGIGNDFNEDLMMSMAEFGSGDYFYIDKIDSIPRIVHEGINGLLSVVANDTLLKIKGVNGATLTKLYTFDDYKAKLGDLRDGETRRILAEFEVKPGKIDQSGEFFKCKMKYRPSDNLLNMEEFKFKGTIQLTDDESKLMEENQEVMDLLARLKIAEEEDHITHLIDLRQYDKAEELINNHKSLLDTLVKKNSSVENLTALDQTRRLEILINESKAMQDYTRLRKHASYSSYTKRRSKSRDRH